MAIQKQDYKILDNVLSMLSNGHYNKVIFRPKMKKINYSIKGVSATENKKRINKALSHHKLLIQSPIICIGETVLCKMFEFCCWTSLTNTAVQHCSTRFTADIGVSLTNHFIIQNEQVVVITLS